MRRADGHADQGPWRRSRLLGDRCALDRSAPVANRRLAPARNSRDDAKEVRLRLARRCRRTGEISDLRRQQCAALRYPAKTAMLDIKGDRFAMMKAEYEKAGPEPSNTRYGYVVPNGPIDHSVFA